MKVVPSSGINKTDFRESQSNRPNNFLYIFNRFGMQRNLPDLRIKESAIESSTALNGILHSF